MIVIQADALQVIIGLAVTIVLGFGVGPVVRCVGMFIQIPPPNEEPETVRLWTRLIGQNTGGAYIGFFERLIFFAAFWIDAWLILSSWLAFKLAFYWQGANFTTFPQTAPKSEDLAWLVARRQLGTHHVATVLVGTAANIVTALVGYAVVKWIKLP